MLARSLALVSLVASATGFRAPHVPAQTPRAVAPCRASTVRMINLFGNNGARNATRAPHFFADSTSAFHSMRVSINVCVLPAV